MGGGPPEQVERSGLRWLTIFLGWSSLTVLWGLSIGLGGSPDEPAHVVKAVAVANLQFDTTVSWEDGAFGASIPRTHVEVPGAYGDLHLVRTCWTGDTAVPASCMERISGTEPVASTTYVGTYPPTYYLAVGWPSRILPPEPAIYGMRVVAALVVAALLTEGSYHLTRRGLSPPIVAGAALAIPASILLLSSSVNPAGLEIASAFCLWAVALGLPNGTHGRRELAAAAVATTALTWTRPLGPVYALVIVAIAVGTLATPATLRSWRGSRSARVVSTSLGASALAAVAFAVANRSYSSLITYEGLAERGGGAAARGALGDLGQC